MKCSFCNYHGHPLRLVTLSLQYESKDDGSIIQRRVRTILKREIPTLVERNSTTEDPRLVCAKCGERWYTRRQRQARKNMGGA